MTLQVACEAFITSSEITCECEGESEETIQGWIDQASDVIAIITGGQISGRCTDVVRPRGDSACGCTSQSCCVCRDITGITLAGPNPTIDEILIDGHEFDDWLILDGRTLIRGDGRPWPACQDLTADPLDTGAGSFQITYTYGQEIPLLAKEAAAEIICMMLRHPAQSTRGGHPNVRSVSIAGVSISLEQIAMEAKGRAFLMPYVARLLVVYAPDGANPAVVYSPELEDGYKLHRVTATGL